MGFDNHLIIISLSSHYHLIIITMTRQMKLFDAIQADAIKLLFGIVMIAGANENIVDIE